MDEKLAILRKNVGWSGLETVQPSEEQHEKEWEHWIDGLDREDVSPALTAVPLPTLPGESSSPYWHLLLDNLPRHSRCRIDRSTLFR